MDVLSLLVHRSVGLRRNEIADEVAGKWCREDKCKSGANHQGNTSTCQDMDKRECFLGAFSQTERFRGGPLAFQDVPGGC